MSGNSILSLVASVLIYVFLGFLVIALFFSVFPLLAVLLLLVLAYYALVSIINFFRHGAIRAHQEKKFDEYGNRKTTATVIGMEEASSDPEKKQPDKKDEGK